MAVSWFIGCTGSGKTTLALEHGAALVQSLNVPLLIVDSMGCAPLAKVKHFKTWEQTANAIWKDKKNAAFIPSRTESVERLFLMARRLGNCTILLDEASFWLSNRKVPRELELTYRTNLHVKNLTILNTTQNISEISPLLFQCLGGGKLYAFRCISPRTIERLEKDFGCERDRLRTLKRGEYITIDAEW